MCLSMNKYGFSALGRSFSAALRGFCHCVKTQRNMRIHLVAALHVFLISPFYRFSKAEYGVLFVTCGLVLGCEAVNTAIEEVTDSVYPHFSLSAGRIKDIAAGAVLLCALSAAAVGVLLFWDMDAFARMKNFFSACPWALLLPAITLWRGGAWAFSAPGKLKKKRKS